MRSIFILNRLSISHSTSSRKQWLSLSHMFVHIGAAWEYQLYQALQEAKQEDRSIQDFYSLLFEYWEELQTMDVLFPDSISVFALEFQKQRDRRNLFHFDMWLRLEFEALRSSILHRHPLPASLKQWLSSPLKRHVSGCYHYYLLQFSQSPYPQLLQHRTIVLLVVAHRIVSHPFMGKWTKDNSFVGPQLNRFNARIANNSATWFLPSVNEEGSMV